MVADGGARYDPEVVRAWYDAFGAQREWTRWDDAPGGATNLAVHQRFVDEHVRDGDLVLDVGSGPGRFAIQAVHRGARVVVTDLSPAMLAANEERVAEAGAERGIVERRAADVTDLSAFDSGRFDVTLCLGGPLSYAYDLAEQAFAELVRVTRPGGTIIASVMSLYGAFRTFLPGVVEELRRHGVAATEHVLRTGELSAAFNRGHQLRMFSWATLRDLVIDAGCEVLNASASNVFVDEHTEALDAVGVTEDEHDLLRAWELEIAREPGALGLGTHILVAARTPV